MPKATKTRASELDAVLAWIAKSGDAKTRAGMARYGIPADKAVGIKVGSLRDYAKRVGRDHALSQSLWKSGGYEARLLASFVGEAETITPAQMDRWCRDFDNWAVCDTACFALFDRSPHAWNKVFEWAKDDREFVKRASFALMASLTVHDKKSTDAPFEKALVLIERSAHDPRNFVKKAINWALRSIGKRNAALHGSAVAAARRLAGSKNDAARWVGKDALRELTGPSVARRLAKQQPAKKAAKQTAKKAAPARPKKA